ncbi:MAG: hypothetical protein R3C14_10670 [Caldilineaceae bacterium]
MDDGLLADEGAFTGEMPALDVPAFQTGGRVERTGIALVHEGEYIMPAPGSEAQISGEAQGDGVVINYYFPIEIEIIGALSDEQIRRVSNYVFDELTRELASRI